MGTRLISCRRSGPNKSPPTDDKDVHTWASDWTMIPSGTFRLLALFIVVLSTAGCDQATKHFARSELSPVHSTVLPGGFVEFTLAENPGAFLSLGAGLPETVRGFLTAALAAGLGALFIYLIRVTTLPWLSFIALGLVWAGGMSNLIDRFFRHGLVTDFILIRVGPLHTGVFNLADMAIVFGIAALLLSHRGAAHHVHTPTKSG